MRDETDRALQLLAKSAAAVWFRDIEVVGRDRFPGRGPVLVVASHFNGIIDPLLVATVAPRLPRFLAKSTLWNNPVVGRLMDVVGALPVHRATEGSTERNERVFAACDAALRRGEAVALFPEGITHDEPRISELRTGAARIALSAKQAGVTGLRIVPVGLVYTAKTAPRSRALIRVGEPIDLDEHLDDLVGPDGEATPANTHAVRCLTDMIRDHLASAALDYDDSDLALVATLAATIALRPPGASRGWEHDLHERERCARALVAAPAEAQARVVRALMHYVDELSLLGITDAHLVAGDLTPSAVRWRLGRLGALSAMTPAAAIGAAVNGPAVGLVWSAGYLPLSRPMRATARLLTGLVALPVSWGVARWRLARRGWREPTLAALVAGPGCGLVALSLVERLRALRSARESLNRLRDRPAVVPTLWTDRNALVDAVADALEASGEPAPVVAAEVGEDARG